MGKTKLTQAYLGGQAYEVVKPFYPNVVHLQFQIEECHKMLTDQIDWANPEGDQVKIDISKPLPLSGPPSHVTIQTQFFFNKDLDYLCYGSKGSRQALSISKMKVAYYHDFRLELLMPEHMWIDDVCTYDISASYAYSRYWYDYLKEITLRRADHQEYTIAEKDFKNLYLSDFEDLNLLLLQGHLNHLLGSDKRMLSTTVNLWTRLARTSRVTLKCSQSENGNPAEPTSNKRMVDVPIKRTRKLGDSDVHTLEDPTLILEILSRIFFLRLNLPDHRWEMEESSSGVYFITACSYSTNTSNDIMKVQAYVSKLPQL
ncbi:hypothetical protein Tco_0737978 [Tanacetum coccineum]